MRDPGHPFDKVWRQLWFGVEHPLDRRMPRTSFPREADHVADVTAAAQGDHDALADAQMPLKPLGDAE